MSNEQHVEEMYYFAHQSGVFNEFSYEIVEFKKNNPLKDMYEVVEYVFEEFVNNGMIQTDLHLFI